MNIVADLHTHTICCGHAYSTLREMAEGAHRNGIKIIATTDHGPNMPGAADLTYFTRLGCLPEVVAGTRILKGVEANIVGQHGELDVPDEILATLDIVLVGFHPLCGYTGKDCKENTRAMIGAIQNPLVDLIVHPGNPFFPIDVERVVEAALEQMFYWRLITAVFVEVGWAVGRTVGALHTIAGKWVFLSQWTVMHILPLMWAGWIMDWPYYMNWDLDLKT